MNCFLLRIKFNMKDLEANNLQIEIYEVEYKYIN